MSKQKEDPQESEERSQDKGESQKDQDSRGGEVVGELGRLGKQLGKSLKGAWDSEDRKEIQTEVVDELKLAGDQVKKVATEVTDSKPAQELMDGAGQVSKDLGDGLLKGLKALNREIGRALDHDQEDINKKKKSK